VVLAYLIFSRICIGSQLINALNSNLPHWRTTFSTPLNLPICVLCLITTLPHVLCVLPTPIFCRFHVSAQPLPPAVLALQPPQFGTHYLLASIVLPLQTISIASLKLTASSRPTAPPSGSAKCLRFGHWLTLCTLNIHLLTYLLTYSGSWQSSLTSSSKFRIWCFIRYFGLGHEFFHAQTTSIAEFFCIINFYLWHIIGCCCFFLVVNDVFNCCLQWLELGWEVF